MKNVKGRRGAKYQRQPGNDPGSQWGPEEDLEGAAPEEHGGALEVKGLTLAPRPGCWGAGRRNREATEDSEGAGGNAGGGRPTTDPNPHTLELGAGRLTDCLRHGRNNSVWGGWSVLLKRPEGEAGGSPRGQVQGRPNLTEPQA